MRRIQKTFSLEPMTSRMPSVLPAYKDNVLYYFDDNSLKEREYQYPSNYGMIPLNLRLSGVTFVDDMLEATSGWSGVTLGSEQCFCNEWTEEKPYVRPCNAMIPKELSDSAMCDYSDAEIEKHTQNNDLCDFTLSFERLSNWYYFFKEYYHLLNDYGHCNRTYSSAQEYYYYESGERYADQMIYGTNEQTYIDLDNDFKAKGGIVDVDNIKISGATDIGFYKWICDNIVPSYYISKEYAEYWKRNKLYYPDVIKWIAWFNTRLGYDKVTPSIYSAATYSADNVTIIEREHWDCKNSAVTDCCDCEEYFNRGGEREYNRMKLWYDDIQKVIKSMNDIISANTECFIPTMDDKIQLHNSLDDLGQYTIFSKEYELGIDYRTASYGDTENTYGGTVVEVSGNTMILRDGDEEHTYSGFTFSPYYMEKQYDENAWEDYTERYIKEYSCEFIADGYSYYTFDNSGRMFTGTTTDEVINAMSSADTYDITTTDAILIDGILYPIEHSEYGIYDTSNEYIGGKMFFVYREKDTSTPYTLVNGKKVYAEWYPYPNPSFSGQPCYYFTFFKNDPQKVKEDVCDSVDNSFNITNYKPFGRRSDDNNVINYISYLGQIFQVTGETLTIGDAEYYRIHGYTYDKNNELMYCLSGENKTTAIDSHFLLEVPRSSVNDNKIVIGVDYDIKCIYNAKELSGQTISRLTDLESTNLLIDDIGNKIDGQYVLSGAASGRVYNHQPPQNSELELLYQVGNTSNIRRFKLTAEKISELSGNTNYFVGNIITEMIFYYKDVDGNKVTETEKNWTEFSSSLSAITASTSVKDSMSATTLFDDDDIYCDITYYIGATLSRESGETTNTNFKLAYADDPTYNYGVEYKETVKFIKENREYYLKKQIKKQIPTTFNSVSSHSVSYPIYVYKLEQELHEVEGDVYNTYFQSPLAKFKTEINLITKVNEELDSNFSNYKDMDKYNNIHVSPTFKEEYMLGISSLENIDSDIYIERGINAAFEKHLKLGEITSMEALEQYSNGYFKIMEN